jgi:hypothetical protein
MIFQKTEAALKVRRPWVRVLSRSARFGRAVRKEAGL